MFRQYSKLKINLLYPVALLGLLVVCGCLSEILLPVPEYDHSESLVIRAAVVDRDTPYVSVHLSRPSNFVNFELPRLIPDAVVILSDDQNHQLEIPMTDAGLYELAIPDNTYPLRVQTGRFYQLSVTLPDGKTYLSSREPLYPAPVPDSIGQELVKRTVLTESGDLEEQEFIRFLINSPVVYPGGSRKAYLKWHFLGTYRFREGNFTNPFPPDVFTCYFFEDLQRDKVFVLDGAEIQGDRLSGSFLLEEAFNYRFAGGFYLTVYQQSLSPEAYRYWKDLGAVVDQSGSFFDVLPGAVKTNFRNINDETERVFGYFYATQEVVLRYYIPPVLDRVKPFCPTYTRDPHFTPAICLDCLVQPGSTRQKPAYWLE